MAYGNKYFLSFQNRQNVTFQVYILEKDYIGDQEELEGGNDPFILDYQSGDEVPIFGIRASSAKINFFNNGDHPLSTFESNTDDKYKVEYYRENTDLLWTGFLVQDDCKEEFAPTPYLVSLLATDNLGLLKDTTFEDGDFTPLYVKANFFAFFYRILAKTGLELPINTYVNLFENGMDDRSVLATNDPFLQSMIDTRTFLKDEQSFDNCYSILDKILKAWKCSLCQASGEWHIIRWLEAKDFNNAIPGTKYTGLLVTREAVTLNDVKAVGLDLEIEPINANHIKSHINPVKKVELTFNYEAKHKLIINDDLQKLGAFISSQTIGGIRYDDYELEGFDNINGNAAFIRVETDTTLLIERDRYVYQPTGPNAYMILFRTETIEVNQGDRFTASFRYAATADTGSEDTNGLVVILTSGATTYYLNYKDGNLDETYVWNTTDNTSYARITRGTAEDLSQSATFDLASAFSTGETIVFPADGTITMGYAMDFNNAYKVKDFKIDYYTFINDSTQITGHVHTSTQEDAPKKNFDEIIYIDDAPKNSVRGVMFLNDEITKTTLWHRGGQTTGVDADFEVFTGGEFEFTGQMELLPLFQVGREVTVSNTTLNNITFTIADVIEGTNTFSVFAYSPAVTADEVVTNGHLEFGNETLKFGYIQKIDTMFLNDETRIKIEGDYFGLKDDNGHISLLTIFTVATLTGKYFILGPVSFNFMRATWSGVLEELWNENEEFNQYNYTNTFKYLYRNQ